MPSAVEVIINAGAGSVSGDETRRQLDILFKESSISASIRLGADGEETANLIKQAAAGESKILIVGGGDGTVSGAASEAVKADKILGILPLGTLNNFSKDLGLPQELAEAVRMIAAGRTRMVDVAEANGRIFINNSSIGLYPRIVMHREKQQRLGRGKWLAAFGAALRMFRISPFLKVSIQLEGKELLRRTPFVFVGNNEYEMELYNIGRRERLDKGQLSLYFLRRSGRWGVALLLIHTLTGRLKQWEDFEAVTTDEVVIQTRKRLLPVALDGEVVAMESPLNYRIRPKALKVLVPSEPQQSPRKDVL